MDSKLKKIAAFISNWGTVISILVMFLLAITFVLSLAVGSHDSKAEEMLEQVIEAQTGIEVDLTPGSPEENNLTIAEGTA